jgi:hypothetical protein
VTRVTAADRCDLYTGPIAVDAVSRTTGRWDKNNFNNTPASGDQHLLQRSAMARFAHINSFDAGDAR